MSDEKPWAHTKNRARNDGWISNEQGRDPSRGPPHMPPHTGPVPMMMGMGMPMHHPMGIMPMGPNMPPPNMVPPNMGPPMYHHHHHHHHHHHPHTHHPHHHAHRHHPHHPQHTQQQNQHTHRSAPTPQYKSVMKQEPVGGVVVKKKPPVPLNSANSAPKERVGRTKTRPSSSGASSAGGGTRGGGGGGGRDVPRTAKPERTRDKGAASKERERSTSSSGSRGTRGKAVPRKGVEARGARRDPKERPTRGGERGGGERATKKPVKAARSRSTREKDRDKKTTQERRVADRSRREADKKTREADKKRQAAALARKAELAKAKEKADAVEAAKLAAKAAIEAAENAKKAEEEEKRRAQEEEVRQAHLAKVRFEEEAKAWETKMELRKVNVEASISRKPMPKKLDSSIKKTQAFIRKLKMLGDHQGPALAKELAKLNLSRYGSEVVNALVEARLNRTSEIQKCAHIASLMHQRYPDFSSQLLLALTALLKKELRDDLEAKKNTLEFVADDTRHAVKVRGTLRVLTELLTVGVYNDASFLIRFLSELEKKEDFEDFPNLPIIISFLKGAGEEFLGVISRRTMAAAQHAEQEAVLHMIVLADEQRTVLRQATEEYFQTLGERLQALYQRMRQREKKNARLKLMRGEVPEALLEERKMLREKVASLVTQGGQLADILDKDAPTLPDEDDDEIDDELEIIGAESHEPDMADSSLFDDETTREFYEVLKDMRLVVPPVLLAEGNEKEKAKERKAARARMETEKQEQEEERAEEERRIQEEKDRELAEAFKDTGMRPTGRLSHLFRDIDSAALDGTSPGALDLGMEGEEEDEEDKPVEPVRERRSHPVELLLAKLPQVFNCADIDDIAAQFCIFNTKSSRRRLVEVLSRVPRSQTSCLPYYSRLIATLSAWFKDIGEEVVIHLQKQFTRLFHRKDQTNLESKLHNIRYLSELTKFRVAKTTVIFRCWHYCLVGFTPHNIKVICLLLENCGRWLYRNPETHLRCNKFLERMMNLKKAKFLDSSVHSNLLENAFYMCRPPQQSAMSKMKERSVLHKYIRWLVYDVLQSSTVEQVLGLLRKLPWDKACFLLVLKTLCNVSNVKYGNIWALADVGAGLNRHQPLGTLLVDAVLEEIRFGLDTNVFTQKQRRLAYVRYLGELFVYKLVESQVIFDQVYMLLTYGHSMNKEGEVTSEMDPPDDFFRVQLVCEILSTCGVFFDHGVNRKRLERVVLHFQRYMFLKVALPMSVQFWVQELFDKLRPRMKRYQTVEEVLAALETIDRDSRSVRDRLMTMEEYQAMEVLSEQQMALAAQQKAEGMNAPVDQSLHIISEDEDEGDEGDEEGGRERQEAQGRASILSHDEEGREDKEEDDKGEDDSDEDDDNQEKDYDGHDEDEFQPRNAKSAEDEEFKRQLERMLQDDAEARKYEARQSNMTALFSGISAPDVPLSKERLRVERKQMPEGDEEEHVVFRMLSRNVKGGGKKQTQVREVRIPLECEISANMIQQESDAKREEEEYKRIVLDHIATQAKEEDALRNPYRDSDLDIEFHHRRGNTGKSQQAPQLQVSDLGVLSDWSYGGGGAPAGYLGNAGRSGSRSMRGRGGTNSGRSPSHKHRR